MANVETAQKNENTKEKCESIRLLPSWARDLLLIYDKVQRMNRSVKSSSQERS